MGDGYLLSCFLKSLDLWCLSYLLKQQQVSNFQKVFA